MPWSTDSTLRQRLRVTQEAAARRKDQVSSLLTDKAARNRARRHRFLRRAVQHTEVVGTTDQHGNRYVIRPADPSIGHDIFVYGSFDEYSIRGALEVLKARGQTPTMLVDVGANIGPTTITVLGMLPEARAVAIEPAPENYRLLEQNIVANDLTRRVSLIHAAGAAASTKLLLELSPSNPGDHRIRAGTARGGRATIEVPGRPLDEIDAIPGGPLTLIWIDVQGFEVQVLAGADRLLASGSPVVVEFWPEGLRRSQTLDQFLTLASKRSIYELAADGPEVVTKLSDVLDRLDTIGGHADLLLLA